MEFHCRPEAARRSTRRPFSRISERVRNTAEKLEWRQARGGARGMPGERKYETSTLSLRAQTVETYAKAEVTITTSRMGRPTIPDVRKVTTSSKSALSYRPVTQVGSGGLAQAIGAKAIVRRTRAHATQCRRFIGHESGTPSGAVCQTSQHSPPWSPTLRESNETNNQAIVDLRADGSRSATLDGSHSLGARYLPTFGCLILRCHPRGSVPRGCPQLSPHGPHRGGSDGPDDPADPRAPDRGDHRRSQVRPVCARGARPPPIVRCAAARRVLSGEAPTLCVGHRGFLVAGGARDGSNGPGSDCPRGHRCRRVHRSPWSAIVQPTSRAVGGSGAGDDLWLLSAQPDSPARDARDRLRDARLLLVLASHGAALPSKDSRALLCRPGLRLVCQGPARAPPSPGRGDLALGAGRSAGDDGASLEPARAFPLHGHHPDLGRPVSRHGRRDVRAHRDVARLAGRVHGGRPGPLAAPRYQRRSRLLRPVDRAHPSGSEPRGEGVSNASGGLCAPELRGAISCGPHVRPLPYAVPAGCRSRLCRSRRLVGRRLRRRTNDTRADHCLGGLGWYCGRHGTRGVPRSGWREEFAASPRAVPDADADRPLWLDSRPEPMGGVETRPAVASDGRRHGRDGVAPPLRFMARPHALQHRQ